MKRFLPLTLEDKQEKIQRASEADKIDIRDFKAVVIDTMYFNKSTIKGTKTETGISLEFFKQGKKVKQSVYMYVGIAALCHNGLPLTFFVGSDIRHRIYEILKAAKDMSRFDEDSIIGRELAKYLEKHNITVEDLTLHFAPAPSIIEKSATMFFLTELKKILINDFDPVLNTAFKDEVVDESEE